MGKESLYRLQRIKNLFVDFVYRIIDFVVSAIFLTIEYIFYIFIFIFAYIFLHCRLGYSFQTRFFFNWRQSNSIFRQQISNVCAAHKSDWRQPRKTREETAFTYDALLSLVSIHDRRSPHHRLTLPCGGKKKRNGDMPGKAVGQKENVERDAAMRERSFRKIRWIRCAELF